MIRRRQDGLGAAEAERLNTWSIEIATALLPPETKWNDEGDERKFHKTGLSVNRVKGCWYSHTAKVGSYSTLRLVEFLRGSGVTDAIQYASAWLASHPGTGTCVGSADRDDADSPSKDDAQDVLDRAVDPSGTLAEVYWRSRKIEPPFPDCVRFLANARCGEGAAVGVLTACGRVLGVELTYLDHLGRKSTVLPQRRTFKLEKVADAVFDIPSDNDADVVICEGSPDLLSLYRWGACRCRLIGIPGIGVLAKLRLPANTKVIVVAQGDAAGSPAAKGLEAGLDKLILDGCEVQVTEIPPEGVDVNDILLEAGVDGVRALLASAQPAALSLDGDIERLARLPLLDYERVRVAEAKRLNIRVAVLDEEVAKRRGAPPPPDDDDWADTGDTEVWTDEVEGAELLDGLDGVINRFVCMSKEQRWAVALWVVFTHAFDAALSAPKLWVRSAEPQSGKTRLVTLLSHLVRGPLTGEGMSASAMVRLIEKRRPTMLLDEVDNWVKDDPDLRRIINSGFDPGGQVWIQVKTAKGDDWDQKAFSTWTPQLLAGLGNLHPTNADRSFKIELERKSRGQRVERLRRTTDISAVIDLRLKAARWARDNLDQLRGMSPKLPEALNDRASDAWELCVSIADLCSPKWGERARQAAIVVSGDGYINDDSIGVKLLSDIRDVFNTLRERDPAKQSIASQGLVERLTNMEDRPWPEFRRGRPITPPQLARLLRPFHISPTLLRLNSSASGVSRGYRRRQFDKVFERYLPPLSSAPDPAEDTSSPIDPHDFTVTPLHPEQNCQKSAESEPLQEGDVTAPETSKNASDPAACNGVAAENAGSGDGTGKKPNGEDISAQKQRPRGEFETDIRAYAEANPGLTPERIGKHFGCSRARVERILGVQPQ